MKLFYCPVSGHKRYLLRLHCFVESEGLNAIILKLERRNSIDFDESMCPFCLQKISSNVIFINCYRQEPFTAVGNSS